MPLPTTATILRAPRGPSSGSLSSEIAADGSCAGREGRPSSRSLFGAGLQGAPVSQSGLLLNDNS